MLSVELNADITRLQQGLAQAQSSLSGFTSSASSTLQQFGQSFSEIGQKLSLAFSVPLGLLGKQALSTSADFEQTKIAFETMLGSASKATYLISELQKESSKSPLENSDLQNSAKTLLNFGVAGNSIIPIVKNLSDISQGNSERFSRLSLAFGQTSATGRLMGQDLLQMVNAGFNPLQEISRTTGESMSSLKKKMEDGGISVQDVSNAFVTATSEGGRFFNSTEKQSKTLAGVYSTMKDNISLALKSLGDEISNALNLKELLPKISETLGSITSAFAGLDPSVKKAIVVFGGLLVVIPPILAGIGALIPVFSALSAGIALISAPVLAVGAGIAGLAYIVVTNWSDIKSYLTDTGIWDSLKQIVTGTFGVIKGTFELSVKVIKSIWNDALSIIHKDTFGIFGVISGVISSALQIISGIINVFSNALQGNWKGLGNSLVNILKGSFNFMVTMTEGFVLAITGVFRKLFEMIGADTITKSFKSATDSIRKTFEGFKYSTKDLSIGITSVAKSDEKVDLGGGGTTNNTPTDSKAQLKAKADFFKNTQKLLSDALSMENSLINEKWKRELAIEQQAYEEKKASINKEVADTGAKHRALEALERVHQMKMAEIVTSNNFGSASVADGGMQSKGTKSLTSGLGISNPLEGLSEKLNQSITNVLKRFDSFSGQLAPKVQQIKDIMSGIGQSMKSTLQEATSSAFVGLSNVFGAMIAGTASIQDAGKVILGIIGNVFSQMGQMFIQGGVALSFLNALMTNPFTSGGAMIAAGVLLNTIGSAISSSVSSGGASGGSSSASSGYSNSYSSGNSGYNNSYNQSNAGRAMTLNIKLSGDLKASGNDLRYTLEKNIRQTVRTVG